MYTLSKYDILLETNRRNSVWEKDNKMAKVKLLNLKTVHYFPKFLLIYLNVKNVSILHRRLFFLGISPW